MGLIRAEALIEAMKRVGLVPDSTTAVTIRAAEQYVRIAYDYVDENGEHVSDTTRIIDAHARGLDQLDWASLISD